jgi:pyruvate/2-oxoglutarate dehydrogenase complex dihydrolipoamide acyltransferase (E2) component
MCVLFNDDVLLRIACVIALSLSLSLARPLIPTPGGAAASSGGRVFASPLAKVTAAKAGVTLNAIPGTGPNNRIVKADVEQYGNA